MSGTKRIKSMADVVASRKVAMRRPKPLKVAGYHLVFERTRDQTGGHVDITVTNLKIPFEADHVLRLIQDNVAAGGDMVQCDLTWTD